MRAEWSARLGKALVESQPANARVVASDHCFASKSTQLGGDIVAACRRRTDSESFLEKASPMGWHPS
jgi:hypothetical protein